MTKFSRRLGFTLGSLVFGSLWGADAVADFEEKVRHLLAEVHADSFQQGDFKACVAIYHDDAKFFVDNQLAATGTTELLNFYRKLKKEDGVQRIEVERFVEIHHAGDSGWVVFSYRKVYDLRVQDPEFLKEHQLEGFTSLILQQYGTAMFRKIEDRWKIQTMAVFDPEIWEPKK